MNLSRLFLSLFFLVTFSSFLAPQGCGKKGPPLPPDSLVPEAVTGLAAAGKPAGLLISWILPEKNSDGTDLVDLSGFKLYKRTEDKRCPECPSYFPEYAEIDLEMRTGYLLRGRTVYFADNQVESGGKYFYKVAAFNKNGYFGAFSDTLTAEYGSPPKPPTGIEASAGDKTVRLKWDSNRSEDNRIYGYNVYRTTEQEIYRNTALNETPLTKENFTDIGVENNSKYYYVVRSVIKAGETYIEGASSEEISIIPIDMMPPPVPTGVKLVPVEEGVAISWIGVEDGGAISYNIYKRREGDLAVKKVNRLPVKENYFIDGKVEKGEIYIYSVSSVDDSPRRNESLPSDRAFVRIPQ